MKKNMTRKRSPIPILSINPITFSCQAHLALAMLSDIEESVEQRDASIKRSYKFQVEQSSPSVQTTFLIGEQPGNSEAFQLHHVAAQVAQSTSAQTDSEHKETGDNSKLSFGLQQTALSASAVTTLAGEVADFDVAPEIARGEE